MPTGGTFSPLIVEETSEHAFGPMVKSVLLVMFGVAS